MRKRTAVVLVSMLLGLSCNSTPPPSGRQADMALKSKCRADGARFAADWKAAHPSGDAGSDNMTSVGGWLALDEYAYSPQLNTCLWSGEYNGAHGPLGIWHAKLILDVYANKRLIEFTESDGKQIGEVLEADFEKRKAELFRPR